jgi:hypothetical protein
MAANNSGSGSGNGRGPSGQAGGHTHRGPSLHDDSGIPDAPPRVEPTREGGGGHIDEYAAEHWAGESEREPGEDAAGDRRRFSEDGYTPERVDSARHAHSGSAGGSAEGRELERQVTDRLQALDDLDATAINVRVQGTEVTLSGYVDDEESLRRAEQVVRQTAGVSDVTNSIRLASDQLGTIPAQPRR